MLDAVIDPEKVRIYRPSEIVARTDDKGGEHRNFIDCVKSRKPCYAPAETGPSHDHHPAHRQYRHATGPQTAMEPRGRAIRRRSGGRRDAQPQTARAVDDRQHRLMDPEELMIMIDVQGAALW